MQMTAISPEKFAKADAFLRRELMKIATYKDKIPRMAEYRIEHSYRVAYIGAEIAEAEGFSVERCFMACLLHDIGYAIDFTDNREWSNHGRYGAEIARPFLQQLGYSEPEVAEMCYGIAIHADGNSDFEGIDTPLALTVQDADDIDRFDAYRMYESLQAADYMNLPLAEQETFVTDRIARLEKRYELPRATPTADKLWKDRVGFQLAFFHRLKDQINRSR